MYIKAIEPEWKKVLNNIQNTYPQAIIAGGSLRDMVYSKPVVDVDIFIKIDEEDLSSVNKNLEEMQTSLGIIFNDKNARSEDPEYIETGFAQCGRKIHGVFNFRFSDFNYDIVFIETKGASVIETFDLSINQICHDGFKLETTEAFNKTFATSEVTCNVEMTERIINRIRKFSAKFPELIFPKVPENDENF